MDINLSTFCQYLKLQEAGIPIDMVGGVSIGAFMGALWCAERNVATVTQKAREWSKKMTQWYRQLLDLTYPITSMFSGRGFNQTLRETFGDVYIEDLWTPYFTLTTDITASSARVHTNGKPFTYKRTNIKIKFNSINISHLIINKIFNTQNMF